ARGIALAVDEEPVAHVLAVNDGNNDGTTVFEIHTIFSDERAVFDEQGIALNVGAAAEASRMKDVKPGEGPIHLDALDFVRHLVQGLAAQLNEAFAHPELSPVKYLFPRGELGERVSFDAAALIVGQLSIGVGLQIHVTHLALAGLLQWLR